MEWLLVASLNDCGWIHVIIKPYIGILFICQSINVYTLHVQDQSPPSGLKQCLTMKWRQGKDMPNEMGFHIQSIVLGNIVYVGGGDEGSDRNGFKVMVYDILRDQCTKLPHFFAYGFTMTSFNNQVVLAGGLDCYTAESSNHVAILESEKSHPYPPMNIGRRMSTAVSFNNHIIIAGGEDDQCRDISSVEVLDVTSNRWYTADPLPGARKRMKSVVVGDMFYLMGGFDHTHYYTKVVHRVNLMELIEKAISMTTSQVTPTTLWQTVEDTPLFLSSPLALKGSLLAVGGQDGRNNPSTSIHLYYPGTRRWVKVGDLPTARHSCTCSVLPNGEVMVAGGVGYPYSYLSCVDFLTVAESS